MSTIYVNVCFYKYYMPLLQQLRTCSPDAVCNGHVRLLTHTPTTTTTTTATNIDLSIHYIFSGFLRKLL